MPLPPYADRGAAALVALHDQELRRFIQVWKEANATGAMALPKTDDPSYASMAALLRHVLRSARGYMTWMCEKLELPDPDIMATWEEYEIEAKADSYLEHLLEKWAKPLAEVPEEAFSDKTYLSRWKVPHTIEEMLEHAVVHPMRHSYQLQNLMKGR